MEESEKVNIWMIYIFLYCSQRAKHRKDRLEQTKGKEMVDPTTQPVLNISIQKGLNENHSRSILNLERKTYKMLLSILPGELLFSQLTALKMDNILGAACI